MNKIKTHRVLAHAFRLLPKTHSLLHRNPMAVGDPYYVTREGLLRMQSELHELKTVKRREVAGKIERAKELGDLSENAEYQDAKEELAFVEGHIQQLEAMLAHAEVIESQGAKTDLVRVGSTAVANSAEREVT